MSAQPAQPTVQPQNLRHLLYMYGAVTQVELNGFLEANSVDDDARKQQIKADWRVAAQYFQEIRGKEAGEPDTISTQPLSETASVRAEALRGNPTFQNTFSNYPVSFEDVEVDKLVACQRTVHIEYVEHIKAKFQSSNGDLIDFCLTPGEDSTPIVVGRTAQNAFTASSDNPSLRFLGAFEQPYAPGSLVHTPSGQPVHAIVLVLGYSGSTVNAYRVGSRLILNNGFHRLYALRDLGVTRVPIVVQQVTHAEVELPPALVELPREHLVSNPRPALLKDFFDNRLTCVTTQRNFIKSVQVGWGINEGIVPR